MVIEGFDISRYFRFNFDLKSNYFICDRWDKYLRFLLQIGLWHQVQSAND